METELPDMELTGFAAIEVDSLLRDNTIDIDSLFAPAPAKEEVIEEPERVQCPHCSQWFEVRTA